MGAFRKGLTEDEEASLEEEREGTIMRLRGQHKRLVSCGGQWGALYMGASES